MYNNSTKNNNNKKGNKDTNKQEQKLFYHKMIIKQQPNWQQERSSNNYIINREDIDYDVDNGEPSQTPNRQIHHIECGALTHHLKHCSWHQTIVTLQSHHQQRTWAGYQGSRTRSEFSPENNNNINNYNNNNNNYNNNINNYNNDHWVNQLKHYVCKD